MQGDVFENSESKTGVVGGNGTEYIAGFRNTVEPAEGLGEKDLREDKARLKLKAAPGVYFGFRDTAATQACNGCELEPVRERGVIGRVSDQLRENLDGLF